MFNTGYLITLFGSIINYSLMFSHLFEFLINVYKVAELSEICFERFVDKLSEKSYLRNSIF